MKIIFICTKPITFNTFLKSQANFFIKKGYEVEIACSDVNRINFKNIIKHKIDFPKNVKEIFNILIFLKVIFQIKKIVKKNKFSIFYLHTPLASCLFRLITLFDKLKIIYFVHGFRFISTSGSIKNFVFKVIEKFLSINTSCVITINNDDYNYAKFNLLKKIPCYKINGVGLNNKLYNLKKNLKIKKKNGIKNVLVIAAYKKEKGYLDLLKIAQITRYKKIKFKCYGYGNYKKFYNIKIKNKLENISFNKFDKNLKNKINKFDILLHLSKREGLPVALMESLSLGLPVICYKIRGNKDLVVNNYNGYLINSYEEVPYKIYYLNLENNFFNKMRLNSTKSIDEKFFEGEVNFKIYNILRNKFKISK